MQEEDDKGEVTEPWRWAVPRPLTALAPFQAPIMILCPKWRSGDVRRTTMPGKAGLSWRLTWHCPLCGREVQQAGSQPGPGISGSGEGPASGPWANNL